MTASRRRAGARRRAGGVTVRLVRSAATVLVLGVLGGCAPSPGAGPAGGSTDNASERAPSAEPSGAGIRLDRYVALGDSYTSAPYVGVTDLADGCLRSARNYPSRFAEEHDVGELVDVSCAGATTADLTNGQRPFGSEVTLPPQLDAVTPGTDLVTLGIGGNDTGLFGELARTCTRTRSAPVDTTCLRVGDAALAGIGRNVRRVLAEVRARAPGATIVLVGYPRILDGRRCADRLPVQPADVAALTDLTARLDDELSAAARSAGVRYLEVHAASAGHDVCSAEPWVNGIENLPGTAMALHPLAREQQAVAELLAAELSPVSG